MAQGDGCPCLAFGRDHPILKFAYIGWFNSLIFHHILFLVA
jgi:hypothetical protein